MSYKKPGFYLCVDHDASYGRNMGFQLCTAETDENLSGSGYRIAGPKYCGMSKNILSHAIDRRDIEELRGFLNRASRWLKKQERAEQKEGE